MKSLQLAAIIVLSITIAMVTTVMIIMSIGMVKKPCPQCPPCEERLVVVEEEEVPNMGLNIEQRAPMNLPPLPQMNMGMEMEEEEF